MAITEQQAREMPLGDLKSAVISGESLIHPSETPPEIQQLEKSFADFVAATPDFQKSPENIEALMSHIAWQRLPTVDDLTQAHAISVYRNEYKAPEVQPENPYEMPLEKLRDQAFGTSERDPAYSMDLPDLKKAAGLES